MVVVCDGNVCGLKHVRRGVAHGDAKPGGAQHRQVVARVTHRDAPLRRNAKKPAQVPECRPLAHAPGRELERVCLAKGSLHGYVTLPDLLKHVEGVLAHHRVHDVLRNRGRVIENPTLDVVHLVAHAHEHVMELPKPIAVETIEASRRVIGLRTREDLEHNVLAAMRLQKLRYGGRVNGALGEKTVATQVEQVRATRADGIGDVWQQVAVWQHHAGAATRGNGHNLAGARCGVNGFERRGQHALLAIEKRPVHVKGNKVEGHAVPSVRFLRPWRCRDRASNVHRESRRQPISTAAVETRHWACLSVLVLANTFRRAHRGRRWLHAGGLQGDFGSRWAAYALRLGPLA